MAEQAAWHPTRQRFHCAALLLQIITAFNSIRGNALMALCATAAKEVESVLQEGCALLANVPVMRKLGSGERAAHLEACRAMVDTVCPLVLQLFKQVRLACECSNSAPQWALLGLKLPGSSCVSLQARMSVATTARDLSIHQHADTEVAPSAQVFTASGPALPDTAACAVPVQELLASTATSPRRRAPAASQARPSAAQRSATSPQTVSKQHAQPSQQQQQQLPQQQQRTPAAQVPAQPQAQSSGQAAGMGPQSVAHDALPPTRAGASALQSGPAEQAASRPQEGVETQPATRAALQQQPHSSSSQIAGPPPSQVTHASGTAADSTAKSASSAARAQSVPAAQQEPTGFGGFGADDDSDGSYDDAAW